MRTDSDRNLSAEADPNPARKTRERVLTYERTDCNCILGWRKNSTQRNFHIKVIPVHVGLTGAK